MGGLKYHQIEKKKKKTAVKKSLKPLQEQDCPQLLFSNCRLVLQVLSFETSEWKVNSVRKVKPETTYCELRIIII